MRSIQLRGSGGHAVYQYHLTSHHPLPLCLKLFYSCRYALKVPESLPMDAAAPLLCAGITVYSPMKYYGIDKPGMRLGVVGLGGLGHMAVKFGKVNHLIT